MIARTQENRKAIVRHIVLGTTAFVYFLPFLWMVLTSFKSRSDIFNGGINPWPHQWALLENYSRVVFEVPMPMYLLNGVVVCVGIIILQILTIAPASYALSKLQFRGSGLVMFLVIIALAIPAFLPTLPLYIVFHYLGIISSRGGLFENYLALILPFAVSAFGIFLFRQHFKSVPDELVQAARLDGMSEWTIVWRVMVPQARPALVAFCIFSIVAHWNDLLWPLIVVTNENYATPPVGMLAFMNEGTGGGDYGALMAAATFVTLPIIAIFILGQRYMTDGLSVLGKDK